MSSLPREDLRRLYSGPFDDFVKRRKDLAITLRQAGRREQAALVQKLAKPTFSAWIVNHLYWHRDQPFRELLQAGNRLRQKQKAIATGQGLSSLHRPRAEVREAVGRLLAEARRETVRLGRSWTTSMERRVLRTLETVAQALPDSLDPPLGEFTEDLTPGGFEALLELAGSLPTTGKETAKGVSPSPSPGAGRPKRTARRSREGTSRDEAGAARESRRRRARSLRDRAARDLRESERRLGGLLQKREAQRRQREDLAERLTVLSRELTQMESRVEQARKLHDRNASRLERAERVLKGLTPQED